MSTVKSVHRTVAQDHPISVNTVATVMNRLVSQKILVREGRIRHYVYRLAPAESVLKAHAMESVETLMSEFGESCLVHFVDAIDELDPNALAKLEAIVRARTQEKLRE
ncbi:MAG: BlaI/MecI/CopY family transcriptional regulator [Firmicutes bacterium]|nr:BlaI/MecI/CopY family transcriptional regulator [Bacillota bacterium]